MHATAAAARYCHVKVMKELPSVMVHGVGLCGHRMAMACGQDTANVAMEVRDSTSKMHTHTRPHASIGLKTFPAVCPNHQLQFLE